MAVAILGKGDIKLWKRGMVSIFALLAPIGDYSAIITILLRCWCADMSRIGRICMSHI